MHSACHQRYCRDISRFFHVWSEYSSPRIICFIICVIYLNFLQRRTVRSVIPPACCYSYSSNAFYFLCNQVHVCGWTRAFECCVRETSAWKISRKEKINCISSLISNACKQGAVVGVHFVLSGSHQRYCTLKRFQGSTKCLNLHLGLFWVFFFLTYLTIHPQFLIRLESRYWVHDSYFSAIFL